MDAPRGTLGNLGGGGVRGGRTLPRAFTLIELVVVIGVIMVLIALAAPALGKSMQAARLTRSQVAVSQNAKLITLYASAYKDIAPIWSMSAEDNRELWCEAVRAIGLVTSWKEIDPEWIGGDAGDLGTPGFYMNRAFHDRVDDLTPGQTEPEQWAVSDPVRVGSALYPDKLILVSHLYRRLYRVHGDLRGAWCCVTSIRTHVGAVGFTDGHVESGYWTDFIAEDELVVENNVGWPAYSTWYGHRGRSKK
jgi:type II secretory pathway pseudopilin PulG